MNPKSGSVFRGPFRAALATAALTCLMLLGFWRGGGLLPADRHRLSIAVLGLGCLWMLAELATGQREPPSLSSSRTAYRTATVPPFVALAALAGWTLASASWSLDPAASVWAAGALAGGLLYLGLGRYLAGVKIRGVSAAILISCALGGVVSVASLYGYYAQRDTWFRTLEELGHAQGPIGYANGLAALLLLTLTATLALVARPRPWPTLFRALASLIASTQLWTLWLSRSRGAGLAFLAAAGLWAAIWAARTLVAGTHRGRREAVGPLERALAIAVLAAMLVSAAWVGAYGYQRATDPLQSPDQGRVQTWQAGLEAALDRPLQGWGADTWYEAYLPYKIGPPTRFAHSLPVQQVVELGVVGLVLLAAFVGTVFIPGIKLAWHSGLREERLWLWVGTTAFLVQNLYDLNWYFPALFYLFCLAAGAGSPRVGVGEEAGLHPAAPPVSGRGTPQQRAQPRSDPAPGQGRGRSRRRG